MPTESNRLERRITGRDRRFFIVLASAAVVGVPIAVVLGSGDSTPRPDGCVATIRASIVGGATVTYCGPDAVRACRRLAASDAGLAAQCARIAVALRP